jgi:hypothetical protein
MQSLPLTQWLFETGLASNANNSREKISASRDRPVYSKAGVRRNASGVQGGKHHVSI